MDMTRNTQSHNQMLVQWQIDVATERFHYNGRLYKSGGLCFNLFFFRQATGRKNYSRECLC